MDIMRQFYIIQQDALHSAVTGRQRVNVEIKGNHNQLSLTSIREPYQMHINLGIPSQPDRNAQSEEKSESAYDQSNHPCQTLSPVVCNDSVRCKLPNNPSSPSAHTGWEPAKNNPGLQNNCNHFIVSEQTTNFPSSLSRLQFTSPPRLLLLLLLFLCLLFPQSTSPHSTLTGSPSSLPIKRPQGSLTVVMRFRMVNRLPRWRWTRSDGLKKRSSVS